MSSHDIFSNTEASSESVGNYSGEALSARFRERFRDLDDDGLVASFNYQVGNMGWTSARARHDVSLIAEFERRGIDISVVVSEDPRAISFARKVRLEDRKLVLE